MAGLPDEGFTSSYKTTLAVAALYKDLVHALNIVGGNVPPDDKSAGEITWGRWPASSGRQDWSRKQNWKAPVTVPYIKFMAMEQASGQLRYAHELPTPPRTLQASLVQSTRALANWTFKHPETGAPLSAGELRAELGARFEAFTDLITRDNLPAGGVNLQGMGADQPIFALDQVQYVGQALALIAAKTETDAHAIAEFVTTRCVAYSNLQPRPGDPARWSRPVLDLDDALAVGSIYPDWPQTAVWPSHIWRITRPGSRFEWERLRPRPARQSPDPRRTRCRRGAMSCCRRRANRRRPGPLLHGAAGGDRRTRGRPPLHGATFDPEPDGNAPKHGHGLGSAVQQH